MNLNDFEYISSKTELDTPCSHMLQADQLRIAFQSLQVTQIKEFPTVSETVLLKYSVIFTKVFQNCMICSKKPKPPIITAEIIISLI